MLHQGIWDMFGTQKFSRNNNLCFHKGGKKMVLWETIPFMLHDCCDNVALPPLPLLVASVCQDKQTSRQLSRGLGLPWRTCQGSLPPSLPQWGIPISASDSPRKLKVVPLTNFLWHGKDRNHMWEHPQILFHFNIDLRDRPLAGLVVSMCRTVLNSWLSAKYLKWLEIICGDVDSCEKTHRSRK